MPRDVGVRLWEKAEDEVTSLRAENARLRSAIRSAVRRLNKYEQPEALEVLLATLEK